MREGRSPLPNNVREEEHIPSAIEWDSPFRAIAQLCTESELAGRWRCPAFIISEGFSFILPVGMDSPLYIVCVPLAVFGAYRRERYQARELP